MAVPYRLRPEKPKSKFRPVNCLLLLLVILIIAGISAYFVFRFWYSNGVSSPNSEDSTIVVVEIEPGTSSKQIGQILFDKGLIKDTRLWDIYIRLNKPNLLANKYNLPKNISIKQIANTLGQAPENQTVWMTFPEGITLIQIERKIQENQGSFNQEIFSAFEFSDILENPDKYTFTDENQAFLDEYKPSGRNLEGFMYPNTYAFEKDSNPIDIVNIMLDEFRKQVETLDINSNEFYDVLILASIVEKEGLDDNDRKIVAGILSNRLEIGMMLGVDATLNYATGKSERRNSGEDLQLDSPYNTYKYTGLPPTPISNPRLQSIQVSIDPIETDYLFFLHDEDGTPYYGRNENEHFSNVSKYLDN